MQFPGKLMNQTLGNSKKNYFGPDFGLFGPNLVSQKIFSSVLPLLDVKNCCKLSRMIQTQENGEKPHFGCNLGLLGPNSGRQIFFF